MYKTVTTPIDKTTIAPIKKVQDWLIFPLPLNMAVFNRINPSKIIRPGNMYLVIFLDILNFLSTKSRNLMISNENLMITHETYKNGRAMIKCNLSKRTSFNDPIEYSIPIIAYTVRNNFGFILKNFNTVLLLFL